MHKEIYLEPVGTKYHSFKRRAKVRISCVEDGSAVRYRYELLSYGESVLTCSINVGTTISVSFTTTKAIALGKEITRSTSRHLTCFLNFISEQSGQPLKQLFCDRYKGPSLLRKMNYVGYIEEQDK